jgi:hypothetical protein
MKAKGCTCSVISCTRPVLAKGYCRLHYWRQWRNGDLEFHRKGEKNGRWTGGQIEDGHGRILVYSPNHPYPNRFGTHVYRYRLVMEQKLERFLLPNEIVHHLNGDVSDDRLENLFVMSQSDHIRTHHAQMMRARKEKVGY